MVIQSNMSPAAIVQAWQETEPIFKEYEIPLTGQTLETLVENERLSKLLQELNAAVGSSDATCVEGG
ncbi:hypothetical protein V1502_10555 [Bacillus sp. SCS-153A]|uniref:hypothetical protein n=1 Tax=Rossellomorea sedimentorum TaxID=3115294 RepID=UPI00390667B2